MLRRSLTAALGIMIAFSSCQTSTFQLSDTRGDIRDFDKLRTYLLRQAVDPSTFVNPGPFAIRLERNYDIRINANTSVVADLAYSQHSERSPLLILVHGNKSSKETHRHQIVHLASWGFHAMSIQVPNEGRWVENGQLIFELTRLLHIWPRLLAKPFDVNQIILAGHSFGGSAVSLAAAHGAPVKGLILLDPALFNRKVAQHLHHIKAPVVIIGADEKVFLSKRRPVFFSSIPRTVLETSVTDATHNDAQWPTKNARWLFGIDPFTSKELQRSFAAIMTTSALSMSSESNLDYAWRAMQPWLASGKIKRLRRK